MGLLTKLPRWATGIAAGITEPLETQKDIGWVASQKPPAQYLNWLLKTIYDACVVLDGLTTTAYTWAAKQTFSGGVAGVPLGVLTFGAESLPLDTTQHMLWPGGPIAVASNTVMRVQVPIACKLSKLYAWRNSDPQGALVDVTVWVEGAATALTCTIGGGGSWSDLVHEVTVPAGGQVEIRTTARAALSTGGAKILASVMMTGT